MARRVDLNADSRNRLDSLDRNDGALSLTGALRTACRLRVPLARQVEHRHIGAEEHPPARPGRDTIADGHALTGGDLPAEGDDEFGNIGHKDKGFADKVMFWRKGGPAPAPAADAASEQERLKSLTANGAIVIQREPGGGRVKLPGL